MPAFAGLLAVTATTAVAAASDHPLRKLLQKEEDKGKSR
jgi:hypothetical protein